MKKELKVITCLSFILIFIFLIFFIFYVSAQNETNQIQQEIKCYSNKDCQTISQYWCDGSKACQKLAQCLNPGTTTSKCTIVDDCVDCLNIGYLGCKDGQCQKIRCYKDSDCGESFTKKYCDGSKACVYESINYCYNPGTIDAYCTGKGGLGCNLCAYGCKDGVCIQGQETNKTPTSPCGVGTDGKSCSCVSSPEPKAGCTFSSVYSSNNCIEGYKEICETITCSDTDSGINYYVKGTTMWGNNPSATDTCENEITLREESCVINPGPNEGTMLTSIYKCPNGCKDGACIKGEKQTEEVKCIFKNTKTEQKCYVAGKEWMHCLSYQGTCIVTNLEGYDGEKITWKSSCGGYAYTILDGNNEYAEFDCSGTTENFCQSKQCEDGSWTKCYADGRGYCVCSSCPEIIIKPVCGNKICESGEGQICKVAIQSCEAGKECKASESRCEYVCPEDCKGIEGIYAKLNEKFKLQINQPVKITDYKDIKMIFRDLITTKCEAMEIRTETATEKIKEAVREPVAVTGRAIGSATTEPVPETIPILKCPEVGPMAQLEIINPEEQGKKILTLKLSEAKRVYDVSVSFVDYDYLSRTGLFLVSNKLLTCPKNCICDSEGYTLECKEKEKCEEGKILCPDGICREKCEDVPAEKCEYGCLYNNKCLPIGVRVEGLFCNVDGTLSDQLGADAACENHFECKTNVCIDGKCVSSSLIQKVIMWLKKLFG